MLIIPSAMVSVLSLYYGTIIALRAAPSQGSRRYLQHYLKIKTLFAAGTQTGHRLVFPPVKPHDPDQYSTA